MSLLAGSLLLSACVSAGDRAGTRSTSTAKPEVKLRYLLTPHADDEMGAWSMVDDEHYVVFILLSHGERTRSCDGTNAQPDQGERLPLPQPFTSPGTAACALQRVDSFHAFLDSMAKTQPQLAVDAPETRDGEVLSGDETPQNCSSGPCRPATSFTLRVGEGSARAVFDLGDKDTTPGEVTWAIQTIRRLRTVFPVSEEDDVVSGAYLNADPANGWFVYDHPDQRAIEAALTSTDQGVPGRQYGRTHPSHPEIALTRHVDPDVFCAAMCVEPLPVDPVANPSARRSGAFQIAYGWLAFGEGPYWFGEEEPRHSFFSRRQDFWARF